MRSSGEVCHFSIVRNCQIKLAHFPVNVATAEVRLYKTRASFNGSAKVLDSFFIVCYFLLARHFQNLLIFPKRDKALRKVPYSLSDDDTKIRSFTNLYPNMNFATTAI